MRRAGDFWIGTTFAIVIILGGLLGAYFVPPDRTRVERARRG